MLSSTETSEAEDATLIRKLTFTTKDCQTPGRYAVRHKASQNVLVYVRVRPLLTHEKPPGAEDAPSVTTTTEGLQSIHRIFKVKADNKTVTMEHPLDSSRKDIFTFSHVFTPVATQEDVYGKAALPLVTSFLGGQNGLIFAYGITNSGKTFTMQGEPDSPGIVPRVLQHVFDWLSGDIAADGSAATTATTRPPAELRVTASYVEIYNEKIYDLLDEKRECQLRVSRRDQVFIAPLKEVDVECSEDAFAIIRQVYLVFMRFRPLVCVCSALVWGGLTGPGSTASGGDWVQL